jgi:peptide/nickel transport system permease protein
MTTVLSTRRGRWMRSRKWMSPVLIGALIILIPVLIITFFPATVARFNPVDQNFDALFAPPSATHPFGTDNFGRDVFTRVIYATSLDLQIGVFCVIFPFLFGSLMGILSGYFGGLLDVITMRAVDVVVAFPFIVLVIAIVAMLGPGLQNMYIAVSLIGWIVYARLVRAEVLVLRDAEYIQAARILGYSRWRIVLRHILPNAITPALVFVASDVTLCILLGTTLSFLGLGAQPPTPEWGAMIAEGRGFLTQAWWVSVFPGLAIALVGIGFSLLGDGIADLLRVGQR